MDIKELSSALKGIMGDILDDSAQIIAHTASEYYRDSFRRKGFDGQPWPLGQPKRKGSLLVASGAMANSIHPSLISRERIVVSAGGPKIPYARAHNEGYIGTAQVPQHRRLSSNGKSHTVRAHGRKMRLTRRQYMGHSLELDQLLHDRLQAYVNDRLTQ